MGFGWGLDLRLGPMDCLVRKGGERGERCECCCIGLGVSCIGWCEQVKGVKGYAVWGCGVRGMNG